MEWRPDHDDLEDAPAHETSRIHDEPRYTGGVGIKGGSADESGLMLRAWNLLATTEDVQQLVLGLAEFVAPALDVQGAAA